MVVDIYDRSTDPIVLWYELGRHIFRDFHAQEGRIEKIGGLVCHVCPFPLIHLLVIRPSICERVKRGLSIALALERWVTITKGPSIVDARGGVEYRRRECMIGWVVRTLEVDFYSP